MLEENDVNEANKDTEPKANIKIEGKKMLPAFKNKIYYRSPKINGGRGEFKKTARTGGSLYKRGSSYTASHKNEDALSKKPVFNKVYFFISFILTMLTLLLLAYSEKEIGYWQVGFGLLILPFVYNIYHELCLMVNYLIFDFNARVTTTNICPEDLASVAIVLPSCNEPFLVSKMTLDSAIDLDYPSHKKEIIIVDNSDLTHPDYQAWKNYAENINLSEPDINIKFIHRDGRVGFKPKNLDIALAQVESDFIMFLDIDSTVQENTLIKLIPQFVDDDRLGFIQMQTIPTNIHQTSKIALAQGIAMYLQRYFQGMCMQGGHSLFYGHNAIWRRTVLNKMGDCLEYHNNQVVVCEDFSMSLRAVFQGYYGKGAWVESGEWVPMSMHESEKMWLRWTVGTYQVVSKHLFDRGNLKKFSFYEKLGWFQHIFKYVNSGLSPIYLALGLTFQINSLLYLAGLYILPSLIIVIGTSFKLSLGKMNKVKKLKECYIAFFVLETFITWIRCKGLVKYLMRHYHGWRPTGKAGEGELTFFQVLKERKDILFFCGLMFTFGFLKLESATESVDTLAIIIALTFPVNLTLSVLIFGNSRLNKSLKHLAQEGSVANYRSFF